MGDQSIKCSFNDNIVDYFINCLKDIENEDDFNNVNKIFLNHFNSYIRGNTYYDGCPHVNILEESAIFRIHWCYNKENNENNKCNKCETHYSEWTYTCCLSENCVYGILLRIFEPLIYIGLYERGREETPEPREWIISKYDYLFHDLKGIIELQMDMYYKDKIPVLIKNII